LAHRSGARTITAPSVPMTSSPTSCMTPVYQGTAGVGAGELSMLDRYCGRRVRLAVVVFVAPVGGC
jgi:hypothetical protein